MSGALRAEHSSAPPVRRAEEADTRAQHAESVWVLRLALGLPAAGAQPEWNVVFELAVRERLAALAWMRSGGVIRSHAPPDVVGLWRAAVLGAAASTRRQLHITAEVIQLLTAEGIPAVVLKGPPLSQKLYGEAWARASSDIDLFVPLAFRAAAARVLGGTAWHLHPGPGLPADEMWTIPTPGGTLTCLEIHSSVTETLARVRLDHFDAEEVNVQGFDLPMHSGPTLPVFLAAHLTKHWMTVEVPLLYFVDLLTLREGMSEGDWDEALAAAKVAGVRRALLWALDHARNLRAGAEGDTSALHELGLAGASRRRGALSSVLAVVDSPRDALSVLATWAFPPPKRARPTELAALWLKRAGMLPRMLGDALRSALPRMLPGMLPRMIAGMLPRMMPGMLPRMLQPGAAEGNGSESPPVRAVSLSIGELAGLAAAALRQGRSFWMRPHGISMAPAIPSGAMIRLDPVTDGSLVPGAVVFAQLEHGQWVLHRIRVRNGNRLTLRGDNAAADDPAIDLERVLGIAIVMSLGGDGRTVSVPANPLGAGRLGLRMRRRLQSYASRVRVR